jgi:2-oxoisovalerate dehydrogenase E1 component beta subunit
LLASIRDPNPVIFFEPKALYRNAEDKVPVGDYNLSLEKAEVVKEGTDITLIGYGTLMRTLNKVRDMA